MTKNRRSPSGRGSWCLACNNEATRAWQLKNSEWKRNYATRWREENREHVRDMGRKHYYQDHENIRAKQVGVRLKDRYGITLEDYEHMLADQDGCCKICGRHSSEFQKRLHVDHDHNTGEVRGLLCNVCNPHLGWFEANRDAVAAYLR